MPTADCVAVGLQSVLRNVDEKHAFIRIWLVLIVLLQQPQVRAPALVVANHARVKRRVYGSTMAVELHASMMARGAVHIMQDLYPYVAHGLFARLP